MKKLLALLILLTGFVVCQATVLEKHPPGNDSQTIVTDQGCTSVDVQFDVQIYAFAESQVLYDQGSAFIVERRVDTPYEFSNCLTAILPAIYMDSGLKPGIERWIPLAAGGVGYAESTG